jgi:hypothetical protein
MARDGYGLAMPRVCENRKNAEKKLQLVSAKTMHLLLSLHGTHDDYHKLNLRLKDGIASYAKLFFCN